MWSWAMVLQQNEHDYSMWGMVAQYGAWWLSGKFSALCPYGCRFESYSSRCVATLDKLLTLNCPVDTMGALRGCRAVKFDSCNNLLSSVHTLTVNGRFSSCKRCSTND